jgi:hypothetical protein
MTSAVGASPAADHTDLRHVLRRAVQLGVMQSALVAVFAIASQMLSGPAEAVSLVVLLVVGVTITVAMPGTWTRARTIEGIAGAAGIGFAATGVFLVIDVAVFQPLGLYSNRWLAIGGGSNWWYHPVWWMAGTYLSWMGAWVLANQAAKSGEGHPAVLVGWTLVLAAVCMTLAVVIGVPGAGFAVGTFGVAIMPALALLVAITGWGARRR